MKHRLTAFILTVFLCLTMVPCAFAASDHEGTLPLMIRDFQADGVLFEGSISSDSGMVGEYLGSDKKPVFDLGVWQSMYGDVSQADLYALFHDVAGVNLLTWKYVGMTPTGDGFWVFDSDDGEDGFFPIDGELFGNTENQSHNYHFSVEIHTKFRYQEGATFEFAGDDDVWVFFNGKRVIDLGGVHSRSRASVNMDEVAAQLGIAPGDLVDFDMFYMERHTSQSNLYICTNFDFLSIEELAQYYDIPEISDTGEAVFAKEASQDLRGLWEGYYIGRSGDVPAYRSIRMQVTDCADGTIAGTLAFWSSDDSNSGEYRFEGSLDGSAVSFEGVEWVIYQENFAFSEYAGEVCGCGDVMYGIVAGNLEMPFFLKRVADGAGVSHSGDPLSYESICSNFNPYTVHNGPDYAPILLLDADVWVSAIVTYHWNGGMGDVTTGTIAVVDVTEGMDSPVLVGEWQAQFDQTGWYFWVAPDIVLKAGRYYTIYDSRDMTWSCNDESDSTGFVDIRGLVE